MEANIGLLVSDDEQLAWLACEASLVFAAGDTESTYLLKELMLQLTALGLPVAVPYAALTDIACELCPTRRKG